MREFLSYILSCPIRQREFVKFEFVGPREVGRCPSRKLARRVRPSSQTLPMGGARG